MQETRVRSLGREDTLEKEMATHSSILVWRIPWTEEPGGYSPSGRKESDTTEWLVPLLLSVFDVPIYLIGHRIDYTLCPPSVLISGLLLPILRLFGESIGFFGCPSSVRGFRTL